LKFSFLNIGFYIKLKGKPYTSIEPGSGINNLCVVPNSGMIFMANEAPKMLVYYIPVIIFKLICYVV
jgi:hypothetical protein